MVHTIHVLHYGRQHGLNPTPRLVAEILFLELHVLLLVKSVSCTWQPVRRLHIHVSEWMINKGFSAVNSEKIIFIKTNGSGYIISGLFVDNMMHISSCYELKNEFMEFMEKYSKGIEHHRRRPQKHSWEWKLSRTAKEAAS
jgi:hypothetical protein